MPTRAGFGVCTFDQAQETSASDAYWSAVLDVARENVELIQLSVVRENRPARRIYESAGFLEFGVEIKASKYGDKYYDEALMALDFSRPADFS